MNNCKGQRDSGMRGIDANARLEDFTAMKNAVRRWTADGVAGRMDRTGVDTVLVAHVPEFVNACSNPSAV
jgi:hypothetical protein